MITAKCVQKFRDKGNKIYGYRLMDANGQTQDVRPENLKNAILAKKINVVNLTLTSDGRLIDRAEEHLQSKALGQPPKNYASREDKFLNAIEKIEEAFCKYVGGGDPNCGADFYNTPDEVSYTDQILGVYYPDEYKGDPSDDNYNYGVTFDIQFDAKEKSAWIGWQGDNGNGKTIFDITVKLTSPLISSENVAVIKKAFEKFAKDVKQWIYNDKNGIAQKY